MFCGNNSFSETDLSVQLVRFGEMLVQSRRPAVKLPTNKTVASLYHAVGSWETYSFGLLVEKIRLW